MPMGPKQRRIEALEAELVDVHLALGGVIHHQRVRITALMRYARHTRECTINPNVYPSTPCSCGFNALLAAMKLDDRGRG